MDSITLTGHLAARHLDHRLGTTFLGRTWPSIIPHNSTSYAHLPRRSSHRLIPSPEDLRYPRHLPHRSRPNRLRTRHQPDPVNEQKQGHVGHKFTTTVTATPLHTGRFNVPHDDEPKQGTNNNQSNTPRARATSRRRLSSNRNGSKGTPNGPINKPLGDHQETDHTAREKPPGQPAKTPPPRADDPQAHP